MLDFMTMVVKCEKEVNWVFGTGSSSDPGRLSSHCRGRLQLGALNQKLHHRPKCGPILANQSYNRKVDICLAIVTVGAHPN